MSVRPVKGFTSIVTLFASSLSCSWITANSENPRGEKRQFLTLGVVRADDIDALVERIKAQADQKLKETETIAHTQMEAYRVLSFFIIFLIAAGACFSFFNVRSITRNLPAENNGNGSQAEEPQENV